MEEKSSKKRGTSEKIVKKHLMSQKEKRWGKVRKH